MIITAGFLQVHRLCHGVELFKDLTKIFGSKKSAECSELAEEHALYLRIPGNYEIDSARSSGYIESSLNLKTGESVSLPIFSEKMFLSKDVNYFFHACEQVKNFADFLRVPCKLEAFNDA